jgi:hypothetical protein
MNGRRRGSSPTTVYNERSVLHPLLWPPIRPRFTLLPLYLKLILQSLRKNLCYWSWIHLTEEAEIYLGGRKFTPVIWAIVLVAWRSLLRRLGGNPSWCYGPLHVWVKVCYKGCVHWCRAHSLQEITTQNGINDHGFKRVSIMVFSCHKKIFGKCKTWAARRICPRSFPLDRRSSWARDLKTWRNRRI